MHTVITKAGDMQEKTHEAAVTLNTNKKKKKEKKEEKKD